MSYEPRPGSLAERAIDLLSENPAGMSASALAKALDVPQEQLPSRLGPALYHQVITKVKDGHYAKYRLTENNGTPDSDFQCAVWDDGTIYMEGLAINESGGVALTVHQSRVLARIISGQVFSEEA